MIDILPTGAARVAGVVGQPVIHSLSPLLHTAWLRDLGHNGVYAPFGPKDSHAFERLILSCRSNGIKGLNITAPFKEEALRLSDNLSEAARLAGSVNLMRFDEDGLIFGDSTDGYGLIKAFTIMAPQCDLRSGPVVIFGAGGASRSAASALIQYGCPLVRIINRTKARAEALVFDLKRNVEAYDLTEVEKAFDGCVAIINGASGGPQPIFETIRTSLTVMDMTYRPLKTNWIKAAELAGHTIVDGLQMLIEQARPSFEVFYGLAPNPDFDIRAIALAHLGEV
jgi:shikimate dehydrogenase